MVGVVADEPRIVIVHEPVGSIVQRQPENRHVVRVHHPVRPSHGLPLGDQRCRAFSHLSEEARIFVSVLVKMGKVLCDHVVGKDFQMLMLFPVIEDFKRAEADMRRRHADQRGTGFDLFSIDLVVTADKTERLCGRDTEPPHCGATEILANRRAQDCTTISIP